MKKEVTLNPLRNARRTTSAGGSSTAASVSFDSTASELSATNVQDAIEEVDEALIAVDHSLIVNNEHLYFDKHDGVYGINTEEARGADTFIPFINAYSEMAILINSTTWSMNSTFVIQGKSARYVGSVTSVETKYMRITRSGTYSTQIVNKSGKTMKFGIYKPVNTGASGVMDYEEVTIPSGLNIINATGSLGMRIVVPLI